MNDYNLTKMVEYREEELRRKNAHDMQVTESRQNRGSGNRLSRFFKGHGKDHSTIK